MNKQLSLPELLALVEIIDEHVDRNFPGIEPPRLLRNLKAKFDRSVADHRQEIASAIKAAKRRDSVKTAPRSKAAKRTTKR